MANKFPKNLFDPKKWANGAKIVKKYADKASQAATVVIIIDKLINKK